jgi:hypothetical protein
VINVGIRKKRRVMVDEVERDGFKILKVSSVKNKWPI